MKLSCVQIFIEAQEKFVIYKMYVVVKLYLKKMNVRIYQIFRELCLRLLHFVRMT